MEHLRTLRRTSIYNSTYLHDRTEYPRVGQGVTASFLITAQINHRFKDCHRPTHFTCQSWVRKGQEQPHIITEPERNNGKWRTMLPQCRVVKKPTAPSDSALKSERSWGHQGQKSEWIGPLPSETSLWLKQPQAQAMKNRLCSVECQQGQSLPEDHKRRETF